MKVLIPAAGKGVRSGLSYPKTLVRVKGVPLLIRTLRAVHEIDTCPVVIASPDGKELIEATIREHGYEAEIIVQKEPRGLGDAILCFRESEYFDKTDLVLSIWGDMISVQTATLRRLMSLFTESGSIFAFPSKVSNPCYTYVKRDNNGKVIALLERQEFRDELPPVGESDVGIFMFNKEIVFNILMHDQEKLIGKRTKEIGFLQIVSVLSKRWRVNVFPIADKIDALSFNAADDLRIAEGVLC